jgi:hypothetical protein
MQIEFNNFEHGKRIAGAMHAVFNPYGETVISSSKDGELLGGTIFSDFTGTSLCMHVTGIAPNWLSRNLMWVTFSYVFVQCRCVVALGRVATTNKEAMNFNHRIGFEDVATIKDAVPGGDVIILQMRKENCKWLSLKPKHLKVVNRTPIAA